ITYDVQEIDDSEIKNIEVSKVNVLKDDGFFVDEDDKEMFDSPISDAIKVLFNIENEHDEELGYMLGIGFYDKDGTFIGASNPMQYIGEDFTMQSNNSKNMEEMEFLPVDYEDIDDVDIRIIGVP